MSVLPFQTFCHRHNNLPDLRRRSGTPREGPSPRLVPGLFLEGNRTGIWRLALLSVEHACYRNEKACPFFKISICSSSHGYSERPRSLKVIACQVESSSSSCVPAQRVHQSKCIGYHGFGDDWQFPVFLIGVTDYIVVLYIVTCRVDSPSACTTTAAQTRANLTKVIVVPLPSHEQCRVGEHLDRPVDSRSLDDVTGFRRTRYLLPCRKHLP